MRQYSGHRRTDRLDYLQSMLGQLRGMAEAERCEMLTYLIEMAYIEAGDIIRGQRPSRINGDQRDGATRMALEPPGKVEFKKNG